MSTTRKMLESHPHPLAEIDLVKLTAAIDACAECNQACTACADACLSEYDVDDLTKCIRTCLDCADVCATTSRVLSRQTGYDPSLTKAVLEACVTACKASGNECARHAEHHLHCRICAEVCRRCEQACRDLATSGNRT
jgi:hypothetical protein